MASSKHKVERVYKVTFLNRGEIYEVFARKVSQGGLFGFVEVEELVFGDKNKVVIDPSQERLEREFDGVTRTYVPLHAIVRIDEVEKQGSGRITVPSDDESRVRPFPTLFPTQPGPGKKS